jgi:mannitol/fructose-specific phosphotransferase system IIA component (Ntr-type)
MIAPAPPTHTALCPHCGSLLWFSTAVEEQVIYGFRKLSIADPSIRTKEQAIVAILNRLADDGAIDPQHLPSIGMALLKREELGSTAIGGGVAMPHVKHPAVTTFLGAVAEFKVGIDFASLDGKLVHRVCLLLEPPNHTGEHLRVLIALAEHLRATA